MLPPGATGTNAEMDALTPRLRVIEPGAKGHPFLGMDASQEIAFLLLATAFLQITLHG
jgi:hypothetical protein